MAVYVIIEVAVKDGELYESYCRQVCPIVENHGGTYLARDSEVICLAGDWQPERVVLLRFASMVQLQACFSSPDYLKIMPLREQSTTGRAIVLHGQE